jgi:hypothetical protein
MNKIHPILEDILQSHGICPTLSPAKKLLSDIHWLIHDACVAMSEGNQDEAEALLARADQLAHDEGDLIK